MSKFTALIRYSSSLITNTHQLAFHHSRIRHPWLDPPSVASGINAKTKELLDYSAM
jgi:hypothetical protein